MASQSRACPVSECECHVHGGRHEQQEYEGWPWLCCAFTLPATSRASASSSRGLNGFLSLPMGAGQSTTAHAQPPSRALHVLRVTPSSPASQTNIEPFFDFVVGFEGDSLSSRKNIDAAELDRIVESHEGKSLNLLVWNNKTQATRGMSP